MVLWRKESMSMQRDVVAMRGKFSGQLGEVGEVGGEGGPFLPDSSKGDIFYGVTSFYTLLHSFNCRSRGDSACFDADRKALK